MNKTVLIIAVIILLVVGGGGAMVLNRSQSKPPQPTPVSTQTVQATPTSDTSQLSLKDLLAGHNRQQCTFTSAESKTTGTVFVGDGKVRGDFQAEVNGKTSQSHMLQDGTFIYFWTDGQTKGFKASLDVVQKMSESVMQNYQSQAMDMNKKGDYSCSAWGVDASKFAPPTGVTFQDYTKMMESAGAVMQGTKSATQKDNTSVDTSADASACAACDSLPASAQAQCRSTLNCK